MTPEEAKNLYPKEWELLHSFNPSISDEDAVVRITSVMGLIQYARGILK